MIGINVALGRKNGNSFNEIHRPTTAAEFVTAYNSTANTGDLIDIRSASGTWNLESIAELSTDQFFSIWGPGDASLSLIGRFTAFDSSATGLMPDFAWRDFSINAAGLSQVSSIHSGSPVFLGGSIVMSGVNIQGPGSSTVGLLDIRSHGTQIINAVIMDSEVHDSNADAVLGNAGSNTLSNQQSLITCIRVLQDGRGTGSSDQAFTTHNNLPMYLQDCDIKDTAGTSGASAIAGGAGTPIICEGVHVFDNAGNVKCDIFKRSSSRKGSIDADGGGSYFEFAGILADYQILSMSEILNSAATNYQVYIAVADCQVEGMLLDPTSAATGIRIATGAETVRIYNSRVDAYGVGNRIANQSNPQTVVTVDAINNILSQNAGARSFNPNTSSGTWTTDYNVRKTIAASFDAPAGPNDTIVAEDGADIDGSGVPTAGGNCDGTGTTTATLMSNSITPLPNNSLSITFDGKDYAGNTWPTDSRNIGAVAASA